VRNQIKAIDRNTQAVNQCGNRVKTATVQIESASICWPTFDTIELMLSHSHSSSPFHFNCGPHKKPIYLVANSINQRLLWHAHSS